MNTIVLPGVQGGREGVLVVPVDRDVCVRVYVGVLLPAEARPELGFDVPAEAGLVLVPRQVRVRLDGVPRVLF